MMNLKFAGNEQVKTSVLSMMQSGRIPHAVMIEGDDGLGKRTIARYISAGAICKNSGAPCGECADCRRVTADIHPDVDKILPDGASIKVEQMRKLRRDAYIMPNEGARRVFVIEQGEKMSDISQNSILKVLEEPPKHTMIIILTKSSTAMLETVISRCIPLRLSNVPQRTACEYIAQNYPDFGAEDIKEAVGGTTGNIGLSLALLRGEREKSAAQSLLEAFFDGGEIAMMKECKRLETRAAGEKRTAALDELCTLIEQRISRGGEGTDIAVLFKMLDAARAASEQNRANIYPRLLLVNLCACFSEANGV